MELQTIDNMMIVDYQSALINWDNNQLIELANNTVSKYKGLIVTEDITKDIAKEVATLNNLIKKIEDKRKAIKKDYTTPLTIFENNVKEVTGIITVAVNDLKSQLEIFEQKRRENVTEKLNIIKQNLQNDFNLGQKYLSQIQFKDAFYNKTAKDNDIIADLTQQFEILLNAQQLEQLKIQQEKERIEQEAIKREDKIKARYELINKMNAETGLSFNFESTKHYSDADLIVAYQKTVKAKEKEKIIVEMPINNVCIDVVTPSEIDNIVPPQPKTTYSLLIENLTKEQMDLIVLGLKQKMPMATFKEV